MNFYKIENNRLITGSGSEMPEGFTQYETGNEPQEFLILFNAEQAEYDSKQYARARATEYAALNQFEMQFDDQVNGTTTWIDAINDIKARFPK